MHISVSSQTSLLNPAHFFVFALYDASAPTVLLESQAPAKPYGNPLQITFSYNCVNGHIYIIKLWESVDSTPTGTVRNQYSQTISVNSVEIRLPLYMEADVTPAGFVSGGTSYVDATFAGWDYVLRRNPDTMVPDTAGTGYDNYHQDVAGGWTLTASGDRIQPNEVFIVEFIPKIIVAAPGGTPSDPFSSGRIITADETLTTADLSSALMVRSATSKIAITLPLLSAVADFRFMYFYSSGGSHINARFIGQGTDKVNYKTDRSEIILGQAELLVVYKAFGAWQVHNDLFGVKMVGELLYNYSQTELNAILCSGQELNRDEYPRLWAWIQTLEAGVVVSDATWGATFVTHNGQTVYTKKTCFSTGNGTTTFRMPLLTNSMLRGVDGSTRFPGSIELDAVGPHFHYTFNGHSDTGGTGLTNTNYPCVQGEQGGIGDFKYSIRGSADVPIIGKTSDGGSTKTIMENSGAYLLMRY